MDSLRQYILTVTAAAAICAILQGLETERSSKITRLICGIFLLAAVWKPLGVWDLSVPELSVSDFQDEAQAICQEAQTQADSAMNAIISQQTAAYIEDKAEALGLSVRAEVTVNEAYTPWQAVLYGSISPYGKEMLSRCLREELGISDERQVWKP